MNTRYHESTGATLAPHHQHKLFEESGITSAIVGGRSYRTVNRSEVPQEFKRYQRRPGLLIPMYSPDGTTTSYQLRPDKPRPDKRGKPIKYETPAGGRIIADVHPRMLGAVSDPAIPLWITEGVMKGDALASRGRCAVSLIGVWMSRKKGSTEMLACFDHVALRGRTVYVVFDSDVMSKPEVQAALARLVGDLEDRGARVLVVYLPDAEDGSKVGVDDYLASEAGGTVEYLEEIARPFEDCSIATERISRDERLRVALEHFDAAISSHTWKGTGGYNRRKILRALAWIAAERGGCKRGFARVKVDQRTVAELAGTRRPTVSRAIPHLEADGWLKVDREGLARDEPSTYVLLTPDVTYPYHQGRTADKKGSLSNKNTLPNENNNVTFSCGVAPHSGTPLSRRVTGELRRLRWGYARHSWTSEGGEVEWIERLGPIRGHALECLLELGGRTRIPELIAAMHRTERPSRFRERHLSRLEDAEIVQVAGDDVILCDDWAEKLGIARELGGEYEAEQLARERHAREREAFHTHDVRTPTHSPHNHNGDGWVEELEKLPDPPNAEVLYRMMHAGETVGTPQGPGRLWQVLVSCGQVGVVLDREPDVVTFMHPAELVLAQTA